MKVGDTYRLNTMSNEVTIVNFDSERVTYRFKSNQHLSVRKIDEFNKIYKYVPPPITLDEDMFTI